LNPKKMLKKLLENSKNVGFNDMVMLLECFGFYLARVSGSHHIFINPEIKEIVNIQNVSGQVKPYQIKQFLRLVEKYNLQFKQVKEESL